MAAQTGVITRTAITTQDAEAVPKLEVWKTIKLGVPGLTTADDLCKDIETNRMRISNWAKEMLSNPAFTVATEETEVDLVKVTPAQLGFKKNTRYDDICKCAKELDLELCPNEVGPRLRRQYLYQPQGEWVRIAMKPIPNLEVYLHLFRVEHGGSGLYLGNCPCNGGCFFCPNDLFVFIKTPPRLA